MTALAADFLDRALDVARAAGAAAAAVIRHHYARGVDVETKSDATPVTIADREAEIAIKNVLRGAFPDHAFYGEEYGREGAGDYLWLIDPIDGTKAFVRGYPFFSTQIALMHRGELVLGVSNAPLYGGAAGETAWARRGGGAWLDGKPIRVSAARAFDAGSAISIGNVKALTRDARWNVLGELIRRSGRIRGYGDFLHYHLLASGRIDLVVESDVNILDIAALAVIVREAGGVFSDIDGRELTLDTTSVLAGTPALHAQALALFESVRI
ncbi:MAG: inositol-phosphate phosphatase [Proteobacteria bacterium]|nr:inositol-phosphate phosphatase [Pseudomonadota bacterium]